MKIAPNHENTVPGVPHILINIMDPKQVVL